MQKVVCVCVWVSANKATLGSSPFLPMLHTLRNATGTCEEEVEKEKKQKGLRDEASGMEQGQRFIRGPSTLLAGRLIEAGCENLRIPRAPLQLFRLAQLLGREGLRRPGSRCPWEEPTVPQLLFGP